MSAWVASASLSYFSTEFCDYPGGYVDGKVHDKAYLRAVAERGNEPTRALVRRGLKARACIRRLMQAAGGRSYIESVESITRARAQAGSADTIRIAAR